MAPPGFVGVYAVAVVEAPDHVVFDTVTDIEGHPSFITSVKSVKQIYVSSLLAILDAEDPGERYERRILPRN